MSGGPTDLSDEELVARVAMGEGRCLDEIVKRHEAAAVQVAFRFLGSLEEAEDAAQETFLRIYRNAAHYRPSGPFRSWMFRILTNVCRDFLKKSKPLYSFEVPDLADAALDPEESLSDRMRRSAVALEIRSLPPNQRMALLLCVFEGLSYTEAAASLDVSVKALESLLVRARRALRSRLAAQFGNL